MNRRRTPAAEGGIALAAELADIPVTGTFTRSAKEMARRPQAASAPQ